jgi:RHS repeat-associated protein
VPSTRIVLNCLLVAVCISLIPASIVQAQNTPSPYSAASMTGAPPNSTHEIVREDVALATGNLHVYIPLLSLRGKGGQSFSLGWGADSHAINFLEYDTPPGWTDPSGVNHSFVYANWLPSPDLGGYVTVPHLRASWSFLGDYSDYVGGTIHSNYSLFCNSGFVFRDEYGTSYTFTVARDCSNTGGSGAQTQHTFPVADSNESHGVKLDASNPNDIVVWTKNGSAYHFPAITTFPAGSTSSGPQVTNSYDYDFLKIVDPNGNAITKSGNTITDSVGHTISFSNGGVTWTDSNGQSQTVTFSPGPVGPAVTTQATSCQFTNQFQSSYQGTFLWGGSDLGTFNEASGTAITFPGGAVYNVEFDQLGAISKVIYPGGGYARYDYANAHPSFFLPDLTCSADYREVAAKHVCAGTSGACSAATEATTTYDITAYPIPSNGVNCSIDVVDPAGNRTKYNFNSACNAGSTWVSSNPVETDRFYYQGQSTLIESVHTDYTFGPLPSQVTRTLNDVSPNLVSKIVTSYETVSETYPEPPNGGNVTGSALIDNPTEIDEYDFDGSLKRKTTYTWQTGGNYDAGTGHILDRPLSKTVTDPATNKQSTTTYSNDTIGNLLGVTNGGTNTPSVTTQYQRNTYGDVTLLTDPKLNQTQFTYTSPWIDTACAQSADSSGKPSSVKNALNQITAYKYYSCSGLLASVTDPNLNPTTFHYDARGRLIETDYPDGGQSTASIIDVSPQSVASARKINTQGAAVTTNTFLDGLSRPIQSQLTSDPDCPTGDKTDTTYDALGRVATVSNPYCGSTYVLTTYAYDALGRTQQITHPDNTTALTTYIGRATQVQDEGNGTQRVTRISQSDALGRLLSLCEVSPGPFIGAGGSSSTSLVGSNGAPVACGQDIAGTGFLTTYQYDGLSNLFQVNQTGIASRTFTYDSLSRLLTASNPESGSISYAYDANGNVASKTSPAPSQTSSATVTVSFCYDMLNRLTAKAYTFSPSAPPTCSNGTLPSPAAKYSYDVATDGLTISNPVGRLVKQATTDGRTATVNSYDPMGRIQNQWQCTPQNCGTGYSSLPYGYDQLGDITSAGNGMGVTLTNSYPAGRLTQITSSFSDSNHPTSLLSGVHYSAAGATTSASYGNGTSALFGYDSRLRLTSTTANGFAASSGSTGSASTSGNEQSITGAPATSGTGSVTLSGSLQSKQVISQAATAGAGSVTFRGSVQSKQVQTQAATPGTGTVTVSGAERSKTFQGGCSPRWDGGYLSVSVNGTQVANVFYGDSPGNSCTTPSPMPTASPLATQIATAINGSSLVSATASGSTITLTSKTAGANTNYSLSTQVTSYFVQAGFPPASFSLSTSGSTLTGGANAVYGTRYDSGTSTINVNGHNDTVSWSGSGTTTSSIASALASDINADSAASVTASASGSTVSMTAKTTGASTNYSLASSWTYDSTDFSGSSFTSSNSGTVLGGGANAVYTTVYDSGNSTITVSGHSNTIGWSGSGTTSSSIASALATNINADSAASVTASASGSIVNLAAKTTGAATNYSLLSSSTYDSSNFSSASFANNNSGSTLAGGHDSGATTYDSGSAWIAVNGTQYSVSYGQGSTATSLAGSLAQAINGSSGSPVTATAASTTVSLASKGTGPSTNYSLAVGSSTNQGSSFSQPSFTAADSGGTMSGGANGPAILYSLNMGYAPDGSVTSANDSVNGNWTYSYDAFNRLVGSNQNIGQAVYNYVFDRFGNRWQQNGGTSSFVATFTGNNQYTPANNNRMDGYSYDAAGNLLVDNTNNQYSYDAEGRIIMVVSPITGTSCYVYNSEGQRVRKTTGSTNSCGTPMTGASVDYLYDISGHQIAEVSSSGGWNRGEVYAGETHIATYNNGTNGTTFFTQADWLGTERVRSNVSGAACETISSLPFGDGQAISGSCGDPTPMHFTGKERDSESGLDNFGARYNSSSMGRFMSPDPFYNDSHPENPQSWNEYAYARNNPLRYVDPNGETATVSTTCTTDQQNNKTCNVSVTATVAVYAAAGSKLTQDQLSQAATTIQNSINTAWSGSFTGQDGATYNVSTQVSVSVAGSQDAATQSGAQNVIGLTEGMAISGSANSFVNPRSLFASDSSPDTGVWSTTMGGGLAAQSAHEFGHLLGLTESTNSADLMDSGLSQLMYGPTVHATQSDFREGVGAVSAFQQNGLGMLPRGPNPMTVHAPDTVQTKVNVLWQLLTHKY